MAKTPKVQEENRMYCELSGFPSKSDVIRVAKACGYPMDNQLHVFLVKICEVCDWDTTEVFRAIFNETT